MVQQVALYPASGSFLRQDLVIIFDLAHIKSVLEVNNAAFILLYIR